MSPTPRRQQAWRRPPSIRRGARAATSRAAGARPCAKVTTISRWSCWPGSGGGEIKRAASARTGVRTFDNPTAFRLLAVHRDAVDKERAGRANTTAAELRASIERKVAALKARVLAREEAERQQAEVQGAAGYGE